jgi:hypothetical protein
VIFYTGSSSPTDELATLINAGIAAVTLIAVAYDTCAIAISGTGGEARFSKKITLR